MPFYPHNYSQGSLEALLVIAPVVFILCWLFNAHQVKKFQKKQKPAQSDALKKMKKRNLLVACCVICVLLGLVLYYGAIS